MPSFAEQLSWALYRLDRREFGERQSGDPARFEPYATGLVWAESLLYGPDAAYAHLTGRPWARDTRYSYESFSNAAGWARAKHT